ncbi:hypothetical protein D046_5853A, partial [Vibrio parahaemolyticus V-223/04]
MVKTIEKLRRKESSRAKKAKCAPMGVSNNTW